MDVATDAGKPENGMVVFRCRKLDMPENVASVGVGAAIRRRDNQLGSSDNC